MVNAFSQKLHTQSAMKILLLLLLACLHASTFAQTLKSVYVLVEEDGPDDKLCAVSNATLKSSAEGSLRHNRSSVAYKIEDASTILYVSTIVLNHGAGQNCSASIRVEFKAFGDVVIPSSGKKIIGERIFCKKGGLLVGPKSTMHSGLTDFTKRTIDQCISEIEREAR